MMRRRQWYPIPVLLPGKSHGQRSLVGSSPRCHKESDTTEWLHFHFLLSCTGEGNGNPLQCSCLENPRDGGAWWATVYEVALSWTWLKWLSSSSSSLWWDGIFSETIVMSLDVFVRLQRSPCWNGELMLICVENLCTKFHFVKKKNNMIKHMPEYHL